YRRAFQAKGRAQAAKCAEDGMLEIDEELSREKVRILEDIAVVGELAAWNSGVAKKPEPVRRLLRARDLLDLGNELHAVAEARVRIREPPIRLEGTEPERAAE